MLALRLARELNAGFVFTVEPGAYFIPQLMDRWRAAGAFTEFIDYDRLDAYRDFGGIRIEDNVLITTDGAEVLTNAAPKVRADIESLMADAG